MLGILVISFIPTEKTLELQLLITILYRSYSSLLDYIEATAPNAKKVKCRHCDFKTYIPAKQELENFLISFEEHFYDNHGGVGMHLAFIKSI